MKEDLALIALVLLVMIKKLSILLLFHLLVRKSLHSLFSIVPQENNKTNNNCNHNFDCYCE